MIGEAPLPLRSRVAHRDCPRPRSRVAHGASGGMVPLKRNDPGLPPPRWSIAHADTCQMVPAKWNDPGRPPPRWSIAHADTCQMVPAKWNYLGPGASLAQDGYGWMVPAKRNDRLDQALRWVGVRPATCARVAAFARRGPGSGVAWLEPSRTGRAGRPLLVGSRATVRGDARGSRA
jgi:hypothetical protein